MPNRNSLTHPRRIIAQRKVQKALDMKIAGHTLTDIAAACGWKTPQVAWLSIKRQLLRIQGENDDRTKVLRDLQNARIEEAINGIQADLKCDGIDDALELVTKAPDAASKIMAMELVGAIRQRRYRAIHALDVLHKRQAALFGLDAPKQIETDAPALGVQIAAAFMSIEADDDEPRQAEYSVTPAAAGLLGEGSGESPEDD